MRSLLVVCSLMLMALVGAACASSGAGANDKYPPRADGCAVTMSTSPPAVMSDNIGPVSATCGADVSDDDCLRTLKDQVCKLGGDLAWGVSQTPEMVNGKKRFAGRAAHTQVAAK